MGDGVFPMIHIDAAFDGGTIFSGDWQIDGAGFFWFTGNNREIFAAYLFAVMAERNAPLILCLAISRRPVVSRSKRFTARNTKCSPREKQTGTRGRLPAYFHGVPGRVDRHSGGFVEYYEIFVFIYYIDRKIDRKNIGRNGFVREKEQRGCLRSRERCVQPGRCSVQADLLKGSV